VLLEEARAHRAQAERARGLARQASDTLSIERLEAFGQELDERAEALEQRADDLDRRVADSRDPAREGAQPGQAPRPENRNDD
jgi:hypothetical protein